MRKCRETDLGMVTVPYMCIFILRLFPKVESINSNSHRKKQVQDPDYTPRNADGRIQAPSSASLRVAPRWEPPCIEQSEDNGSQVSQEAGFPPCPWPLSPFPGPTAAPATRHKETREASLGITFCSHGAGCGEGKES